MPSVGQICSDSSFTESLRVLECEPFFAGLYPFEVFMSSFYEIVELTNGDVALQRADDDSQEPLVVIHFSEESLAFLGDAKFTVAKAMIEAGMDAAGDIADQQAESIFDEQNLEQDEQDKLMLH
jgi:hypothetical protein